MIVIYSPGFMISRIRLQPWRYIHELALFLCRKKNKQVVIISTEEYRMKNEFPYEILYCRKEFFHVKNIRLALET